MTDRSGTLIGTSNYAVFGETRAQTGAGSVFGFTGEQHDPVTGFTHLRARDLNPALGRFLSVDTVQPNTPGSQGYNVYAYVANNPTTWADPSGHVVAPALAANWLPFALAAAAILVMDCAANSPLGVCSWIATFLITIFTIVACLLDMDGLCWTQNTRDLERQHWTRDTLPESPNDFPEIPYDPCAEDDKLENPALDELPDVFDQNSDREAYWSCFVDCLLKLPGLDNKWFWVICGGSAILCWTIPSTATCTPLVACAAAFIGWSVVCDSYCSIRERFF